MHMLTHEDKKKFEWCVRNLVFQIGSVCLAYPVTAL